MRAVSNSSPLSNLAIIGRLDLLKRRYGEVRIPPAVAAELSQLSHPVARTRLTEALAEGWLVVAEPPSKPAKLAFPLDPGEAQAIALAVDLRADILLIDERRGRAAARSVEITVAGVLGELLQARGNDATRTASFGTRRLELKLTLEGYLPVNLDVEVLEYKAEAANKFSIGALLNTPVAVNYLAIDPSQPERLPAKQRTQLQEGVT